MTIVWCSLCHRQMRFLSWWAIFSVNLIPLRPRVDFGFAQILILVSQLVPSKSFQGFEFAYVRFEFSTCVHQDDLEANKVYQGVAAIKRRAYHWTWQSIVRLCAWSNLWYAAYGRICKHHGHGRKSSIHGSVCLRKQGWFSHCWAVPRVVRILALRWDFRVLPTIKMKSSYQMVASSRP